MTVSEFQKHIKSIYQNTNEKNVHGFDYFFSYLVRTVASGFKRIRYNLDPSEKFAKCITYLCGICELLHIDLQESFLRRFPGICPYCLTSPCICHLTDKKSNLRIQQRKYGEELDSKYELKMRNLAKSETEVTFDYFADMLHSVYGLNSVYWKVFNGPSFHINKCLEELGEIQEAYSKYLAQNDSEKKDYVLFVAEELCDLMAWVLSAWRLSCPNLSITEFVTREYSSGCPSCNRMVCICSGRSGSADMLLTKADIQSVYDVLSKIADDSDNFVKLMKLFQEALSNNSVSLYKVCLVNTIEYLRTLNGSPANKQVDDVSRIVALCKGKI